MNTLIPKSIITVSSSSNKVVPHHCRLIIKGIRPPMQIDLSTSCDDLTLVGTVASRSSNIKVGPLSITPGPGMTLSLFDI